MSWFRRNTGASNYRENRSKSAASPGSTPDWVQKYKEIEQKDARQYPIPVSSKLKALSSSGVIDSSVGSKSSDIGHLTLARGSGPPEYVPVNRSDRAQTAVVDSSKNSSSPPTEANLPPKKEKLGFFASLSRRSGTKAKKEAVKALPQVSQPSISETTQTEPEKPKLLWGLRTLKKKAAERKAAKEAEKASKAENEKKKASRTSVATVFSPIEEQNEPVEEVRSSKSKPAVVRKSSLAELASQGVVEGDRNFVRSSVNESPYRKSYGMEARPSSNSIASSRSDSGRKPYAVRYDPLTGEPIPENLVSRGTSGGSALGLLAAVKSQDKYGKPTYASPAAQSAKHLGVRSISLDKAKNIPVYQSQSRAVESQVKSPISAIPSAPNGGRGRSASEAPSSSGRSMFWKRSSDYRPPDWVDPSSVPPEQYNIESTPASRTKSSPHVAVARKKTSLDMRSMFSTESVSGMQNLPEQKTILEGNDDKKTEENTSAAVLNAFAGRENMEADIMKEAETIVQQKIASGQLRNSDSKSTLKDLKSRFKALETEVIDQKVELIDIKKEERNLRKKVENLRDRIEVLKETLKSPNQAAPVIILDGNAQSSGEQRLSRSLLMAEVRKGKSLKQSSSGNKEEPGKAPRKSIFSTIEGLFNRASRLTLSRRKKEPPKEIMDEDWD